MEQHTQLEMCERMWGEEPVFFISTSTNDSQVALNNEKVMSLLVEEWKLARKRHGWSVGRFLVMPDRVFFSCAADISARPLSQWLQIWKEWTSKRLNRELGWEGPVWGGELSRDLLSSYESYSHKWQTVSEEPVRAQLTGEPADWPWQGEIERLE